MTPSEMIRVVAPGVGRMHPRNPCGRDESRTQNLRVGIVGLIVGVPLSLSQSGDDGIRIAYMGREHALACRRSSCR